MSKPWTGYLTGAAFALCAAAAATAYAQGAPSPDASRDRAVREADGDAARGDRIERRERRIVIQDGDRHFEMAAGHQHRDMSEHLRTMLQLKPAQEPALQAYLAAVKPGHGADHDHMMHMSDRDSAKTTPERLADMERRMAESQAEAKGRIEATRRFYAQLEPSQKKVFDEMPMLMVGPIGPIGPMMLPGAMKIRFEHPPMPPEPPVPPRPPAPPHS